MEIQYFKRGDNIALFEIGYRTPDNGCDYVYNPLTDQIEEIWGEELRSVEGTEVRSVETRSGWHEVDGSPIFAKRLKTWKAVA
jgi:hypothetical protein